MNREESKKYCTNLVIKFVKEFCDGDINHLCSFDLNKIDKNSQYGKPKDYGDNWCMDPDDSVITRAVLFLLYYDYEELNDLQFSDIGNKYRGDTMFSLGNLIGRPIDLCFKNDYTFWGKQKIAQKNIEKLEKKIKDLIAKYHTLPNFWLLPNKKIFNERIKNNKKVKTFESLNQYRGMNEPGLSDYIDLFLIELQKYINNDIVTDDFLKKLFCTNDFYFGKYKNNFKKFCERHFIQIFFEGTEKNYHLKEMYQLRHYVRWGDPKKQEDYDLEIFNFISSFENMWEFREKEITKKLTAIIT